MAFEFGMFHEFQARRGRAEPDAFAELVRRRSMPPSVGGSTRCGWPRSTSAPERSVCAAPLTIASAIAARTRRMKIGTGVQVLPLCHPLRLGEEAATVDQISHGRLIFGVGRSGFPRTYEAYGVPYGESRERFAETLEILKRAWTEPIVLLSGKFYKFENVRLDPETLSKAVARYPHRCQQRGYVPAIAKLGHGCSVAVRLGTLRSWPRIFAPTGTPG